MVKFSGKVGNLGRITIPVEIREELEIEPGDYVVIDITKLDD